MQIQKKIFFRIILPLPILCGLFIYLMGCSDSITSSTGTAPKKYQARTEKDFADRNLKAEPGAVVVINLEDLHGKLDPEEFDTDLIGVDIIPYRYTETAEHKISIGDSSYFAISLINENTKQVIYELTPTNNHTTVTIPAGDYLLVITSLEEFGSDSAGGQVVFIQPDMEEALNRGGGQGQVDYDPGQLNQLISTSSCRYCDLSNANLSGANLYGANLDRANLRWANLSYANLERAWLDMANLANANLDQANLYKATLQRAKLDSTYLYKADLRKANLRLAWLRGANLREAMLSNSNLKESFLHDAYLYKAVLDSAHLTSAELKGANLTYTSLIRCDLENAIMRGANLSYADLSYSNFYRARLISANLSYSDLRGAYFCEANKTGIITTGVITDFLTQCWP